MNVSLADLKAMMPASTMSLSVKLIAGAEAFKNNAYPDPRLGWATPTIGYGTTRYPNGLRVKPGDKCAEEQAMTWLRSTIERSIIPELEFIPTWRQMNPNQKAAVISFAYNLGRHFYGNSPSFTQITLLLGQPHRWADAADVKQVFTLYRNPGSNVEIGLRRRRALEADLFCTPVPEEKA